MLKSLLLKAFAAAFLTLSVHQAAGQLQGFHFGARFGLGESKLSVNGYQEVRDKLHFSFGFASHYGFNEHVAIGVDLLGGITRSQAYGEKIESGPIFGGNTYKFEDDLRFYDLNVPIMLKVSAGKANFRPYLFGGPSLNFNLVTTEKRTYADRNYHQANGYGEREHKDKENLHAGLAFGAGILIKAYEKTGYFLEFRMNQPLGPAGRIDGNEYRISHFSLNAGYFF